MAREELDRMKAEFVSTVSHELRTPVTSILGYLEVLVDGEVGEFSAEQGRMLAVVERNGRRLQSLIEDLLIVSRVGSDRLRLVMTPVDVARVVDAAVQVVGKPPSKKHLELVVDVTPGLPPVAGDAEQLERAVANVLGNAVKFTPDGGRVRLEVRPDGSCVQISVEDTGIGIPKDEQCHVFERFFRASTARDGAVQGTGLGLSIVKAIIDGHHGNVVIRSAAGAGTTVVMTVPQFRSDPQAAEQAA